MIFSQVYFFSYSSTAFVNSLPVLGYKYPAIIVPTPMSKTKSPIPSKKDPIENIALSRPIGTGHHSEPGLEGDGHRPTEGLEMGQSDLIDMDQQVTQLSAIQN